MKTELNKVKQNNVITCLRVLFFYILSVVILIAVSSITKRFPKKYEDVSTVILSSLLTFELVILFTGWEKLKCEQAGIVPGKSTFKRFAIGFLIGLSMAVLQVLISLCFAHKHLDVAINPTMNIGIMITNLLLYFFVAFREELVFRSYSLRALDYSIKAVAALSVIVVLFILEHIVAGMDWKTAIIGSGLGGILFGLAALRTKGLALPIGLHFAWNFGQWCTGFKNETGIYKAVVEKGYELQVERIGLWAFIIVMCMAIILVLFLTSKSRLQENSLKN